MNIVGRAKGILFDPKAEWAKIAGEPGDAAFLLPNYVMILAAIPPLCRFIRMSFIGYDGFRFGIGSGLVRAIIVYVLSLVMVFVTAYVIDFLAGTFGGRKDLASAMRVASYSPTAAWVAGVFTLIPFLGILTILGLYSIYLLHTGLVALMKPAVDKAVIYTIVVIVCLVVLWFVVAGIVFGILGMGMMTM